MTYSALPRPSIALLVSPACANLVTLALKASAHVLACADVHAVRLAVQRGHAQGIVLDGTSLTTAEDVTALRQLTAEYVDLVVAGVLTAIAPAAQLEEARRLGAVGAQTVVPYRDRFGPVLRAWTDRCLMDPHLAQAIRTLSVGTSPGWMRFVERCLDPEIHTIRDLGRTTGVAASTISSRFLRHRLPAPKQYLAWLRLYHLAVAAQAPSRSLTEVSAIVGHSSQQSMGRHVRELLGITPAEFRERYSAATWLDHVATTLIAPYRATLATFDPLAAAEARHRRHPRLDVTREEALVA